MIELKATGGTPTIAQRPQALERLAEQPGRVLGVTVGDRQLGQRKRQPGHVVGLLGQRQRVAEKRPASLEVAALPKEEP